MEEKGADRLGHVYNFLEENFQLINLNEKRLFLIKEKANSSQFILTSFVENFKIWIFDKEIRMEVYQIVF
jgi:hypothetical protein